VEGAAEGTLAGLIVIPQPVALVNAEDSFAGMVIPMKQAVAAFTIPGRAFVGNRGEHFGL
jgi:hypothetical protein